MEKNRGLDLKRKEALALLKEWEEILKNENEEPLGVGVTQKESIGTVNIGAKILNNNGLKFPSNHG